jgi:hypothetical protein
MAIWSDAATLSTITSASRYSASSRTTSSRKL